jgi:hypothetical protein
MKLGFGWKGLLCCGLFFFEWTLCCGLLANCESVMVTGCHWANLKTAGRAVPPTVLEQWPCTSGRDGLGRHNTGACCAWPRPKTRASCRTTGLRVACPCVCLTHMLQVYLPNVLFVLNVCCIRMFYVASADH